MPQVIAAVQRWIEAATEAAKSALRRMRARWRWFDHLARAYERYQDRRGDRLAAALTSYGFLSFFPLLALAYALLGYLVGVSEQAQQYLVDAINGLLPGLADKLQINEIVQSKTAAGLIGTVGLLFTGLGWVQVLRESLRDIWGNDPRDTGLNFFVAKLIDVGVLAFLGTILIAGSAATAVASSAASNVLRFLGLDGVTGAGTGLRVLSLCVAIFFNTWIFLVLFSRLSGTHAPWRRIMKGALLGAVGFEILKQVATFLLARTTSNPVYASFAVLVGLMVWINLVSRYLFYTAAWTATRSAVMHADNGHHALTPEDVLTVYARPVAKPVPEAG